jgi:Fe-S-cluster containining protein
MQTLSCYLGESPGESAGSNAHEAWRDSKSSFLALFADPHARAIYLRFENLGMRNPEQTLALLKLDELYRKLDKSLGPVVGNPCGTCRECCTADGIHGQLVRDLEFDLIAREVGPAKLEAFRAFTLRERDSSGNYRYPLCPNYDETARGCGIYAHRPFSCRVFGHFQMEGTQLPSPCVFQDSVQVVSRRLHYQEIPLAAEVRDASRRYWSQRGPKPVRHAPQSGKDPVIAVEPLGQEDSLDRALSAWDRADYEGAINELNQNLADSDCRPLLQYHMGQSLMLLGRQAEAVEVLSAALEQAPESWDLHYNLGLNLFQLEEFPGAFRSFVRTIELNPEHALAWGFLGYMALSDGLTRQAAVFLSNALEIDTRNATFQLRLGTTMAKLGLPEKARQLLSGVLTMKAPDDIIAAAESALAQLE